MYCAKKLIENGFCVVEQLLPNKTVCEIREGIDEVLDIVQKEHRVIRCNDDKDWIRARTKLQRKWLPKFINDNPTIRDGIEKVVGEYIPLRTSQIAYRFPGEKGGNLHIDNFTDAARTMKRPEFNVLVGFVLSDVDTEWMGNFTIYPGSHKLVEEWSRKYGGYKHFFNEGLSGMLKWVKPKLGKPVQLCVKAGDVVIANRFTLHLVCSDNKSDVIRKMVWYRVSLVAGDGVDQFYDVWAPF